MSCPSTCTDGYCLPATPVTLTATPASGWSFIGWSSGSVTGGFGSPAARRHRSLHGDYECGNSVTAIFTQITYPLSVSVFGNGAVTSSPSGHHLRRDVQHQAFAAALR